MQNILDESTKIGLYTEFQEKILQTVLKTWKSKSNNSKSRDVRIFWTAYSFFLGDSEQESTFKKFWFPKSNFFQWRLQVAITPRKRVRCFEDIYIWDTLVIRSLNMWSKFKNFSPVSLYSYLIYKKLFLKRSGIAIAVRL